MVNNPKIIPLPRDYRPPEGRASITDLNARSVTALNRLRTRGVVPQGNPLLTSWQLQSLVTLLLRKGLLSGDDINDWQYEIMATQTEDLERLADEPSSMIVLPGAN